MGEKPYKLALMMIVKNESAVIAETLRIISNNFSPDYWVISDTGSTDNTKDVITDTMKELGIPGRFSDKAWVDFSTNRNHVLKEATKEASYVITFDADDGVCGNFVMPKLDADMYSLLTGCESSKHNRPFIFSSKKEWLWNGVLHEYISCLDKTHTSKNISGDYYVQHNRENGSRSNDKHKYFKDALVFEMALIDENTPTNLISRYTYYAGQSYKDAGNMKRAADFFEKTTTLSGWSEEKYLSCLFLGHYNHKEGNLNKALSWFMKAPDFSPRRVEWALGAVDCLPDASPLVLLNILLTIPPNNIADPGSGNYFLIDSRAHSVFFINKILFLSSKCGRVDIARDYMFAQSKMKKYLNDEDIKNLKSNLNVISGKSNHPIINVCRKLLEK